MIFIRLLIDRLFSGLQGISSAIGYDIQAMFSSTPFTQTI